MKNSAFIFPILLVVFLLGACSKPSPAVSVKNDIDYYTCTMHPWVRSKKPGKCPVCAMDLVPVFKNKPQSEQASQTSNADAIPGTSSKPSAQPESHDFDVPVERQQQFGVTYAQAKRQPARAQRPHGRFGDRGQGTPMDVRSPH